jgi:hypothetical protein
LPPQIRSPALPIAWLLWRSAHQIAMGYAGLLRSSFDLHRFDVYEALHWPKPTSPEAEREQGVELTLYLLDGIGAEDVVYTHQEAESENEGDAAGDRPASRSLWQWICALLGCR